MVPMELPDSDFKTANYKYIQGCTGADRYNDWKVREPQQRNENHEKEKNDLEILKLIIVVLK